MSYDTNTASALKPKRSEPQWAPEMRSYTTPGVVVGKWMMWSGRYRYSLGAEELSWLKTEHSPTGHPEHPLCSHSQHTFLAGKTHMWSLTLSHATSSALYHTISFRLLSSEHPARIESVPEVIPPSPFQGSEFSQHHTILTWNSSVPISIKPF